MSKIKVLAESRTLSADTEGEFVLCLFQILVPEGIPYLMDTSLKISDFMATLHFPFCPCYPLCVSYKDTYPWM